MFSQVKTVWWKWGGETGGEEVREGWCQEPGRAKGGLEESWRFDCTSWRGAGCWGRAGK